jgi:hypothetical protein
MGWKDTFLANTAGVLFRARTGSVDPWTLAQQKADAAAAIKKALGPNASPETVKQAQARVQNDIDVSLKQNQAHPDQAPPIRLPGIGALDLPKLNALVNGALAVLAIGTLVYFGVMYRKTLVRQYRKVKRGK